MTAFQLGLSWHLLLHAFPAKRQGASCRQAAVKAATILPLVGLARSKQDPINRGHGAQYLYCTPPAGANIAQCWSEFQGRTCHPPKSQHCQLSDSCQRCTGHVIPARQECRGRRGLCMRQQGEVWRYDTAWKLLPYITAHRASASNPREDTTNMNLKKTAMPDREAGVGNTCVRHMASDLGKRRPRAHSSSYSRFPMPSVDLQCHIISGRL